MENQNLLITIENLVKAGSVLGLSQLINKAKNANSGNPEFLDSAMNTAINNIEYTPNEKRIIYLWDKPMPEYIDLFGGDEKKAYEYQRKMALGMIQGIVHRKEIELSLILEEEEVMNYLGLVNPTLH